MPSLAENKKAHHDYEFLDDIEVGIVLSGQEVKSTRTGGMKLQGSYAIIRDGALWLVGCFIAAYKQAGPLPNYDPSRTRKLLAHKKEIQKIVGRLQGERLTLVPKNAYTREGRIKITVSLARTKRAFEKREVLRRRETEREIGRALKNKR